MPWSLLRRWLGASRPRLEHLEVVLYTRHGCHLCDTAWHRLDTARRRYGFRLAVTDVDTDPELARRYGAQVPVVTVDGKVRFRGCVNPVLLTRLLRAAAVRPARRADSPP